MWFSQEVAIWDWIWRSWWPDWGKERSEGSWAGERPSWAPAASAVALFQRLPKGFWGSGALRGSRVSLVARLASSVRLRWGRWGTRAEIRSEVEPGTDSGRR